MTQQADPRFNPQPNRSPSSSLDRGLGGIVWIGLGVVTLAIVVALAAVWVRLMLIPAAFIGPGLGGILAACLTIAMGGVGLAALAALAWSFFQGVKIRRWMGIGGGRR